MMQEGEEGPGRHLLFRQALHWEGHQGRGARQEEGAAVVLFTLIRLELGPLNVQ